MISYIVLLTVISLTWARPEPPSRPNGYNYPLPPILPTIPNNYPPPSPSDSYGSPIPQRDPTPSYGPPPLQQSQQPQPPQETIIHKHVYVHVAPPEPEYERQMIMTMPQPAQKHYKIVFIKAPSPPAPKQPQMPVAPPSEEKTLVYVLVKKPDDQEVVVPTAAPTQPSKPEVYFIRYKTKSNKPQEGSPGEYPNSVAPPKTSYGTPSFDELSQDLTAPSASAVKY